MLLLTQASPTLRDRSTDDVAYCTRAAIEEGWEPWFLPFRMDEETDLDEVFAGLAARPAPEPAVWSGLTPSLALYERVHAAARDRNLVLPNTPDEHRRAQELDLAYPLLGDLTARSAVVRSVDECRAALATLPLPLFVKGALASRKDAGWRACVAHTEPELVALVEPLLADERAARGRVILRALLPLRTVNVATQDFPIAREYRVFLYRGEVLSLGFYWLYYTLFPPLTDEEERAVRALAVDAARRLGVPFLSIDIAETRDGRFVVIEPGDPQFSGPSLMPLGPMWRRLKELLAAETQG